MGLPDQDCPFDPCDYIREPSLCRRRDYHDGPCNGYPREQCELKATLEREGRIMAIDQGVTKTEVSEEAKYLSETIRRVVRPWYKQAWAWISGRL